MELLAGCGSNREKRIKVEGRPLDWEHLVTLDAEPSHYPDVVHDLNRLPLPFEDDQFSEIHCYEVLEHLGTQGDAKSFFDLFSEFWRILKPGGLVCATVPMWNTLWALGDPSHRRIINKGTLVFLSQPEYLRQVGHTPMSDFRSIYKADFQWVPEQTFESPDIFVFTLEAIKPARTVA